MNVIFLGKYSIAEKFQSAGGKRVLNQIKYLINAGHTAFVITYTPFNSDLPFHKNFKTKEYKGLMDIVKLPYFWYLCALILSNKRDKKAKNILLLESNVEFYCIFLIFFAKFIGYKIVHDIVEDFRTEKDIYFKQKVNLFFSSIFLRNIKKYCSGLIVISENLLDKYQRFELPIIKLYNSVENQILTTSLKNSEFTFLYSGNYHTKDGVLDLINAFLDFSSEHKNIKLNLLGKRYGKYFDICMELIKGNKQIEYLGYLEENRMNEEICKAHVLCVTRSNNEFSQNGFPFKLSEYMSFGIPVLATAVSDIPVILENKKNIFLAEPSNVQSIRDAMKCIYNDYQTAIEVGKNGKTFCNDNFSINVIGKKLEKFLFKI